MIKVDVETCYFAYNYRFSSFGESIPLYIASAPMFKITEQLDVALWKKYKDYYITKNEKDRTKARII